MSEKDSSAPSKLLLKDLIHQVRSELMDAIKARETGPGKPEFVVEGITLEVNFVVETSEKLSGGAKANLFAVGFKAGGETTYRSEQVHKVSLQLSAWDESRPDQRPGDPERSSKSRLNINFNPEPAFDWNVPGSPPLGKIRVDPLKVFYGLPEKKMDLMTLNKQLLKSGYYLMPSQYLPKKWIK